MKQFTEAKFSIPALKGISAKNIEEHLKLYAGYVKNANLILEKAGENELQRRFAFEFDGMRNHEYYFAQFEGGPTPLTDNSPLKKALTQEFGSYENWLAQFKNIALTRGVGWAFLYYDPQTKHLLNQWVDEQHIGHLTGLSPIVVLDIWEHAYVADYQPSGKKDYIEDFFANLNWEVVEKNFQNAKMA
ncbi:MAG: Fe-Mn family superoxide dismutase [Candidatus Paceibacterota bacterium]|jgi:Fe-Mn family superoxide dismutase